MDVEGEAGKSNSQRRPFSTKMYGYTLQVMYTTVIRMYYIYMMTTCGLELVWEYSFPEAGEYTYVYI